MKKSKSIAFAAYFFIFILILAFLVYDNKARKNVAEKSYLTNYLSEPKKYGGSPGEYFGQIVNISRDSFYFSTEGKIIRVYGTGLKMPVYGETVVYINFTKENGMQLVDYHNYNYNYIIYLISFLAVAVSILVFLKEWKFSWGGFKDA